MLKKHRHESYTGLSYDLITFLLHPSLHADTKGETNRWQHPHRHHLYRSNLVLNVLKAILVLICVLLKA